MISKYCLKLNITVTETVRTIHSMKYKPLKVRPNTRQTNTTDRQTENPMSTKNRSSVIEDKEERTTNIKPTTYL